MGIGHACLATRKAPVMAAEFVTEGHPDKVCDQMADAILDAMLKEDPFSRVAIEVTGGHGIVCAIGEVTTNAHVDIGNIIRHVYRDIGHTAEIGVMVNVVKQSPDIAKGVDKGGAGDQGIMVGYAVDDGPNFMPKPWTIARQLAVGMKELRVTGKLPYLKPDGKSLVVLKEGVVSHITLAAQHERGITQEQIKHDLYENLIRPIIGDIPLQHVEVNGTGEFVLGGFDADAGTTGRKLMIDNYGPNIEVGGGCYSGKDPSKVDRSAAYFCRMVAKSIVGCGYAHEALVKVGYTIGIAEPAYISVVSDLPEEQNRALEQKVIEKFDFRPKAMIEFMGLLHPNGWCYRETARAGHYGDDRFPWEKICEF